LTDILAIEKIYICVNIQNKSSFKMISYRYNYTNWGQETPNIVSFKPASVNSNYGTFSQIARKVRI